MASVEGIRLTFVTTQRLREEAAREEAAREQADVAGLAAEGAAVEGLVETYSPLLFRVAHSVLRNRAEAEDVVQDTFVRVLRHRHKLPTVLDQRVWLVRIAWNLALDRKRRVRPEQLDVAFVEGLAATNMPADQAIDEVRRMNAVLREVERLPKGERHVLLLSSAEEMSTAAMAEVLGKTESAVRALLFRARTRLKARLKKGQS